MAHYYNDFDPGAVAWIKELIRWGQIPDGEVDDRSILDVHPDDLKGFTQCHFFAGIAGWPLALQLADVSPDEPLWTGSPPCQPFSVAGEDKGKDDERHLAPKFVELVGACRPRLLFGEQVASAAVFGKATGKAKRGPAVAPSWAWFDDLSDRLEASHYAVGASDIPSAGVGAPHIRQRTFFGAYDLGRDFGMEHGAGDGWVERRTEPEGRRPECGRSAGGLADDGGIGREVEIQQRGSGNAEKSVRQTDVCRSGGASVGLVDGVGPRLEGHGRHGGHGDEPGRVDTQSHGPTGTAGASDRLGQRSQTNSPWAAADWLYCRDGSWRPVEPGTFPLAHGVSGRVGLLRGYGNAINPWAAKEFIEAFRQILTMSGNNC